VIVESSISAGVGLLALGAWYGTPLAMRAREQAALAALCRGSLVLSFDDGPAPTMTPRVLRLLEQHGAHATFFLLGRRAEQHPDLVRAVVDAGHEVGSHSQTHAHALRSAPWTAARDATRGASTVERLVGARLPFRPPYGKATLGTRLAIAPRPVGWWTIDSGDTFDPLPDPGQAARALVAAGGGVVLLHDHDREELPDAELRRAFALDVIARLLEAADATGLAVRRLCDLDEPLEDAA